MNPMTSFDLVSPRTKLPFLIVAVFTALADRPVEASEILRTLVYHQLTAFTNNGAVVSDHSLAISADGRKIAFARVAYGSPRSNLIYAVNFDGTGLNLVDAYPGDSPQVDLSADGTKVLSWHWQGAPVRWVNADGNGPRQVIYLGGGYCTFRLSPDGGRVYFYVDRDFPLVPDSGTHPGGLYVVNADGTSLRHLAGVDQVAKLFEVTPNSVSLMTGNTYLALSGDGSRLLFQAAVTNSLHLLGINADGSGLHELPLAPTPINGLFNFGLDGGGTTAFYHLSYAPCCSSGEELGVLNWDGNDRRVLLSNYSANQGSSGYGVGTHSIQLSGDGSRLLFGDTSLLFNTDGSGRLELGWSARFAVNNVLEWGFYRGVMNADATRFAYLTPAGSNNGERLQIGSAELNPLNPGLAPTITGASTSPAYITTNGPSPLFAFHPAPTNGLVADGGTQAGILLGGIADPATWQGSTLRDNGAAGDAAKGDGIYSDNTGHYYYHPTIGPRTVRYKAELLGEDGNYHATAIDMAPFFVVAGAPSAPPPAILAITPANAPPGNPVTITGTGFDPTANQNVILFGNVPAQVINVNPTATELVVLMPSGLPAGPVTVTVSSTGQTSGAFNLGGDVAPASSLVLKMVAGLEIYGTAGMTYRIDYLRDVANPNSWAALTNIVLSKNPDFWVDVSSTNQPKRFYRSVGIP